MMAFLENAEMCMYALIAKALTRQLSPAQTLRVSRRLAGLLAPPRRSPRPDELSRRAERLAWRWVQRLDGDCYDRAVSARWWLARRGVGVAIVVGVRAGREGVEGHAWIEEAVTGAVFLVEPAAGYREVQRG